MNTNDRRFLPSNRENMRRWVAALRSGAFARSSGVLRCALRKTNNGRLTGTYGYCCLGVAAEVAKLNGLDLTDYISQTTDGNGASHDEVVSIKSDYIFEGSQDEPGTCKSEGSHLPENVRTWLGLDDINPYVVRTRRHAGNVLATDANDGKKWKFDRIADELEYTYMLNFTDEQVVAAALREIENGRSDNACELMAMVGKDYDIELPEPPTYDGEI